VKAEAREVARKAESSRGFRGFARAGYIANGVVHALVGVIVLVVAFGGEGETDQAGAFKAIASAPVGFIALWVLAAALWALGIYHLAEGVLTSRRQPDAMGAAQKWGRRGAEWGQAAVFIALGAIAASVALGAKPNGEEAAEDASRGILSVPGGPFLLGVIGLAIGGGGIAFIVMGVLRSFENKVDLPAGTMGSFVTVLGVVGFVAKGIALVIVGAILLVAAVRVDPQTAGGLDGAIHALLALPFGPLLAGLVGVGFLAYAVFCVFRARYARL
jgi:hypothetical protein